MKNIAVLVLISFLAFATAGVVTLQTSCSFSNSTLFFTIKNIGNDTAYGLNVIPIFEGKEYPQQGKDLSPGDSLSFKLPLQIAENGSYLSILSIGYSDSSGVPVFTLAHCGFHYGLSSPPLLLISEPNLNFLGSGKYKLELNVTNLGRTPINSTLFLYLPLSFFSNISNFSFQLLPAETKQFSATITYKGKVQGVFEGIVFAPFYLDNKHFTSFVTFPLPTYSSSSTLFTTSTPVSTTSEQGNDFFFMAIIAVVIVALLLFIHFKRRKK
jgi:hypothetical protein